MAGSSRSRTWAPTSRSGDFLGNYARSLGAIYLKIGWRSLWMAVLTTVLCLAVSFPIAYYLAILAPAAVEGPAARAGRGAVLDELPDPHLCVDVHPAHRGAGQPGPDWAPACSTLPCRSSTPRRR